MGMDDLHGARAYGDACCLSQFLRGYLVKWRSLRRYAAYAGCLLSVAESLLSAE